MSKRDKEEILEEELVQEAIEEIEDTQWEENTENQSELTQDDDIQIGKVKDALARTQADYENFKKRTERDKADMIFFLKNDIFKKILPRMDDLERILSNTPEEMRIGSLYEGISALQKSLVKDLKSLWVESFDSKGRQLDPERHEVMTQVPGEEWVIVDEFEKWYTLSWKVLRVAKVVTGNGQ